MNQCLVIIPTYNEAANLEKIAQAVLDNLPQGDLLFVDDNSPDGTGRMADALCAKNPRVKVLHRPAKEGLGRAYVQGFKLALAQGYEFILQMDADFSHNPTDLPRLFAAAQENDLVIGSRYVGGIRVLDWPMSRLLLSTGAGVYVRIVTGMPISDPTGGFKCFNRKILGMLNLDAVTSNGYSFQIEINHAAWMQGFKIKEVPIIFADRVAGISKMSKDIALEAFCMVLKLWWQSGCRRSPQK